jgi:hypothetical protein
MKIELASRGIEPGTCGECADGWIPCPDHTVSDGDPQNPFCINCDQPMDESNTRINCWCW